MFFDDNFNTISDKCLKKIIEKLNGHRNLVSSVSERWEKIAEEINLKQIHISDFFEEKNPNPILMLYADGENFALIYDDLIKFNFTTAEEYEKKISDTPLEFLKYVFSEEGIDFFRREFRKKETPSWVKNQKKKL